MSSTFPDQSWNPEHWSIPFLRLKYFHRDPWKALGRIWMCCICTHCAPPLRSHAPQTGDTVSTCSSSFPHPLLLRCYYNPAGAVLFMFLNKQPNECNRKLWEGIYWDLCEDWTAASHSHVDRERNCTSKRLLPRTSSSANAKRSGASVMW